MKTFKPLLALLVCVAATNGNLQCSKPMVSAEQVLSILKGVTGVSDFPSIVTASDLKEVVECEQQSLHGYTCPQIFSFQDTWILKVSQTQERGLGEIAGWENVQKKLGQNKEFLGILWHAHGKVPVVSTEDSNGGTLPAIEERSSELEVTYELMRKGPPSLSTLWRSLFPFNLSDERPLADATSLENRLKQAIPIIQQAFSVVGRCVANMHHLGVIHNDLHLENILYDPASNAAFIIDWDRAELIDFSDLAKGLVDVNQVLKSMTGAEPHVACCFLALTRQALRNFSKDSSLDLILAAIQEYRLCVKMISVAMGAFLQGYQSIISPLRVSYTVGLDIPSFKLIRESAETNRSFILSLCQFISTTPESLNIFGRANHSAANFAEEIASDALDVYCTLCDIISSPYSRQEALVLFKSYDELVVTAESKMFKFSYQRSLRQNINPV